MQILGKTISNKLSSMEAGAFQNFCLDFLPLFDSTYEGLVPFGGTSEGKTRKGTPDLIKTLPDGKQIAVQCSTKKTYWSFPKQKDKFPQSKPCEDIDKCLIFLSNIYEIVLCSSQGIPTNAPNAESEIFSYAKNKTDTKITILQGVKICGLLIKNIEDPKFANLYKNHLLEIYTLIGELKEKERLKLATEICKEKPVRLEDAMNIAAEAMKSILDVENAKVYALKRVDELKSRFESIPFPRPGKVVRQIPEEHPLINPIGKVFTLLGVPKIGKTSLVAQYAIGWNTKKFIIHWFDCPLEENDQKSLLEDVLSNIWACFVSPDKAVELAAGIIRIHSISLDKLRYELKRPIVCVLDGSELLAEKFLKLLCDVLVKLKPYGLLSQIGFIFIGNKGLKYLCPAISSEFCAPPWTQGELKEFLSDQLPDTHYYIKGKYLEILETMSGGHPLIALRTLGCPVISHFLTG